MKTHLTFTLIPGALVGSSVTPDAVRPVLLDRPPHSRRAPGAVMLG
jgi:hypothetical protein